MDWDTRLCAWTGGCHHHSSMMGRCQTSEFHQGRNICFVCLEWVGHPDGQSQQRGACFLHRLQGFADAPSSSPLKRISAFGQFLCSRSMKTTCCNVRLMSASLRSLWKMSLCSCCSSFKVSQIPHLLSLRGKPSGSTRHCVSCLQLRSCAAPLCVCSC